MRPEDLKPGMRAIIRNDVFNGQNGITNAASYRGRVMTVKHVSIGGNHVYFIFEEDPQYYWRSDQVEPYCEEDVCAIIDSSSLNLLLEVL